MVRSSLSLPICCLVCLALLQSCNNSSNAPTTNEPAIIRPKPGPGIIMNSSGSNGSKTSELNNLSAIADRIPAPFMIESVTAMDADADGVQEFIAIARKDNEADNNLFVVIISKDRTNNDIQYIKTNAGNSKTFSINQEDVLGIHKPCMVARGTTKNGKQHLTIILPFKEAGKINAQVIFAADADNAVEIVSAARPASYSETQTNAPAFPIYVTNHDPSSQDNLNLIKSIWVWDSKILAYKVQSTETILGSRLEENKLDQLYKGDVQGFESYMQGAWIKTAAADGTIANRANQIVFFDASAKIIRLIEDERLESYIWSTSFKAPYSRRLLAYMVNESFSSLKTNISVTVDNPETLSLSIMDRPDWEGSYKRIDSDQALLKTRHIRGPTPLHALQLSGLFTGEDNQELLFSGQLFTIRTASSEESGVWVSYKINKTVLTLVFLNQQGMILRTENYTAEIETQKDRNVNSRILTLYAATITTHGAQTEGSDPQRFVQRDLINKQ